MPPVGRIEQGIAPSLMFACGICGKDLRVRKSVIVCLVCDEPEPPEASEPPTP